MLRLAPAGGRFIVARTRIDPASALRRLFLLPERRFGLQVIDDEAACVERLSAMGARYRDENDLIRRRERADTMDDERIVDVEAPLRLGDDRVERLLGHPGVMFER